MVMTSLVGPYMSAYSYANTSASGASLTTPRYQADMIASAVSLSGPSGTSGKKSSTIRAFFFRAMARSSVTWSASDGFNAFIAAPMRLPISAFRRWGMSSDETSMKRLADSPDHAAAAAAETAGSV